MTLSEMVLVGGGFLLLVGGLIRMPALWRGEAKDLPRDPYPGWPFGVPLWRAFLRIAPAAMGFLWFGAIAAVAEEILPNDNPVVSAVVIVGYAGAVCFLVLAAWIAFYNRPKWLVIPHERDDPGLVDAWRQSQRPPRPGDRGG